MREKCRNPLFKCKSKTPEEIEVYIIYKGRKYPICKDCWVKIADSDIEW